MQPPRLLARRRTGKLPGYEKVTRALFEEREKLQPGEPIVLVLSASPHRAAALESCAFLIDWLKTGAPFWKREEFADGRGERWVEAKAEDDAAAARWARRGDTAA